MKSGCPYTFNIINMEKTTSQFNEGKQIIFWIIKFILIFLIKQKKNQWLLVENFWVKVDQIYFFDHVNSMVFKTKGFWELFKGSTLDITFFNSEFLGKMY